MKVVWLSWKDRGHPQSGGAESVSGNIMDRLVRDGHEVKLVTSKYHGVRDHEQHENLEIIRVGNRYTVYAKVAKYYKSHLQNWADVVIDEMNTIPFNSASYSTARNVLLCYQLAREVWLYQMIPPLSLIGYASEPIMLRYLAKRYTSVATESQSSKKDMEQYGFKNINIFRVGMNIAPIKTLAGKKSKTIILSLGSIRPMKRTLDAVKAFETARDMNRSLTMIIAGDNNSRYAQKVIAYAAQSRHTEAITILGRVTANKRIELMRQAALIIVTSIKEGWGLIVTEANSQGTPAIVYDVDGLRDSVKDGFTGVVSPAGNPEKMGETIVHTLANPDTYNTMRKNGWQWSKGFTLENSYQDFLKLLTTKNNGV